MREPGFVASVHGGLAFVSKAIRAPHVECRQRTDAPPFCRLRVSRLPLSMMGPARPARAAGAPGGPPPGGPPPGGPPPGGQLPGGPPPGGRSYAAAAQGLPVGPGLQHQLPIIEEEADDGGGGSDHGSYGHGAGDGDDDDDGAGSDGGAGSAGGAMAVIAAAAAAAAAGPSDEHAARHKRALRTDRQTQGRMLQLDAERRALEGRRELQAAAAVGAAAAAVGEAALLAALLADERMLDASQMTGRKRGGGDEEPDAAADAPLDTPVGLSQPRPRRGEAAPEAAEDGEEGRRVARRTTGGEEGDAAVPAAAPAAAGDFNFVESPRDRARSEGPLEWRDRAPAAAMAALVEDSPLRDAYRLIHPMQRGYTFSAYNAQARLDRLYVSMALVPRVLGGMADIMADTVAAVSRPPPPSPADREAVLGAVRAHSPRMPQAVADAAGALVVTPAEVRAAATHSKPGTAPGPDGIPVDVWRKLGEPAFELLAAVFTAVGATGGTPPGFLDGVVASIYKAKNAADAANYRPLTMLGSDYRILAKVLATRWTPLLSAVVGPEQTAFLAGRRISDNICLTQMLPGLLAANAADGVGPTGAALALLDFRKAYDTIDRGFLIAVMEAVGVGDGVLAWTRTILTHTYASAGFISAPREYAAGVRQGCPAAPALFLFLGHALACFLRTCPAALGPVARITGRVQTAELWGAEAPLWANPLLQLELPAAQRSVQWREPTGDAAGHALFSPTDAARWLVDGLARVRDALPGMRTVTDLCVLWAWLAAVDMLPNLLPYLGGAAPRASPDGLGLRTARAWWGNVVVTCKLAVALQLRAVVDERRVRRAATVEAALALDHGPHGGPRATDAQVFAGLRGLEAAVPTLWRMPLLNARKEPIWRLWPPARSVAVERAGELATMDLWDALASFAEGGGMPRGWAGVVGPTHPFVGVVDGGLTLNKTS
ncbi:hypothetical protein FOA52_005852 [Chlamydomonas sp. UWO 241]|nr:hypothetical protein FOA52_005852 [Chlamydomonas sp. UWO 241]